MPSSNASPHGRARCASARASGADMGPAVDKAQLDTDLEYIEIGKQEGARLVQGGGRLTEGALEGGYYVEPTVFDGVTTSMRVAQEEIFGPVVSVIRVSDFDQALAAANRCATASSPDLHERRRVALRFVDGIETGIVHSQSGTPGGEAMLPSADPRHRVGPREQGTSAIRLLLRDQDVYVDTGPLEEVELLLRASGRSLWHSHSALASGAPAQQRATGRGRRRRGHFRRREQSALTSWSLSYEYQSGASPTLAAARRESRDLLVGKASSPDRGGGCSSAVPRVRTHGGGEHTTDRRRSPSPRASFSGSRQE